MPVQKKSGNLLNAPRTFNNCFGIIMVNTCVVAYCKTEYKKRQHKINVISERFLVFRFP